jgi:hypothetical protein
MGLDPHHGTANSRLHLAADANASPVQAEDSVEPVAARLDAGLRGETGRRVDVVPNAWMAVDLADEDDRGRQLRVGALWPILAVVTAADLILIRTTFNRVLGDSEWLSWLLGAGLTFASVVAAFQAGAQARNALAWRYGRNPHRALAIALMTGWAIMGLAIFWLRWRAADFAPPGVQFEAATADLGDAAREETREQILAVVLAGIYLLTGLLAFTDGFLHTNPAARALQGVNRQIAALSPLLDAKEGRVTRVQENLAIHEYELAAIDHDKQIALASRRALANELKEHARVRIAIHLGDPSKTGLVRLIEPTLGQESAGP